ncbi:MAG: hypothetical protein MUC79_03525 [Thiobacillaceae bacterium]|jgi:chromosome segregation ATPase|nr:hypothetical protein [Thiobacillaceae bacterium]
MKVRIGWIALLVLTTLMIASAQAASDKKAQREREMLRRAQQQLQQAQGQLASLEQENKRLAGALEDKGKAADAAAGRAARLARELKAETRQRETLAKELELVRKDLAALNERWTESRKDLDETRQQLATTAATLRQTQADRERLQDARVRNERQIALCEDKNGKLYQLGRDLMTRYESKGFDDVLKQREPFTGLKRVEVENLLEEYRDRLDEQRISGPP